MSSIQTSSHLPALEEPHEREAVAHELQSVLHDVVDLGLTGDQLRWAVVGPHPWTLRQAIAELVAGWRGLANALAERVVVLGHVPAVQARSVVAGSALTALPAGPVEDRSAVWELTHRVTQVSERSRERATRVAAMDAASAAVVVDVVRHLERHGWLLRSQLGARGRGTE